MKRCNLRLAVGLLGLFGMSGCDALYQTLWTPTAEVPCGDPRRNPGTCDGGVWVDGSAPPPDLGPECAAEEDCQALGAGLACLGGKCTGCALHADCKSQTCDVYDSATRGGGAVAGRCVAPSSLIYVSNRNGGACTSGSGNSPADALCNLSDALPILSGGTRRAVRVLDSTASYGSLDLNNLTATFYGPADQAQGRAATLIGNAITPALQVRGGSTVVLDGFVLKDAVSGVQCAAPGSTVKLRRSQVLNAGDVGVDIFKCKAEVDRVLFSGNKNGALSLNTTTDFAVSNSYFLSNTGALPTVRFNSASGSFVFNTITRNASIGAIIDCGGGASLGSSIILGNAKGTLSQFVGTCALSQVVYGADEPARTDGIAKVPEFVNAAGTTPADFKLTDSAGNVDCCIDKASAIAAHDYFGGRRGTSPDVGAHEVR